jgi:hypothetical protein
MADKKQQAKESIELATKAGRAQDASEFKTQDQRDALMELVKADNAKKSTPAAPPDRFADATAEMQRRGYIGSAIDKMQGKDNNKQTGTPATHTEGNF